MSNVVSLTGINIADPSREAFMAHMAQSYDEYVSLKGYEPEAIVFTWCGIKQEARTGWLIRGDSIDAETSIKGFAMLALMKAATED